jgi:hypothetical protein
MVNVDGLRMMTKGTVRISVSGRVRLVEGREPPALTAIHGPNRKAVGPWKPSSTS